MKLLEIMIQTIFFWLTLSRYMKRLSKAIGLFLVWVTKNGEFCLSLYIKYIIV